MTQPIQEPGSTTRTDAKLTWGSNQLFRRPPPSFRIWGVPDLILSGGATIIPTDTLFPIPWADYATPHTSTGPTAPFVIDDAAGTLFTVDITDDGDAGNDRYEISTMREGWWANEMITQWDQVSTAGTEDNAGVMQRVTWTGGMAFSPTEYRDSSDWFSSAVYPSFGFAEDSYLHTVIMPHHVAFNKTWISDALQRTGIDRGLSGVKWAWWFIEEDDLDAWTFGNVFD